jgi:nucleoside-diphosphate-sugar epimerase
MTRLAADVGFRPRHTLADGIARYAEWLRGGR